MINFTLMVYLAVRVGRFKLLTVTLSFALLNPACGDRDLLAETKLNLEMLATVILQHSLDSNRYPNSDFRIEDLLVMKDKEGNAYLRNDKLFKDHWGQSVQYVIHQGDTADDTAIYIYSFGPDRKNQFGRGDDIKVEVRKLDFLLHKPKKNN